MVWETRKKVASAKISCKMDCASWACWTVYAIALFKACAQSLWHVMAQHSYIWTFGLEAVKLLHITYEQASRKLIFPSIRQFSVCNKESTFAAKAAKNHWKKSPCMFVLLWRTTLLLPCCLWRKMSFSHWQVSTVEVMLCLAGVVWCPDFAEAPSSIYVNHDCSLDCVEKMGVKPRSWGRHFLVGSMIYIVQKLLNTWSPKCWVTGSSAFESEFGNPIGEGFCFLIWHGFDEVFGIRFTSIFARSRGRP